MAENGTPKDPGYGPPPGLDPRGQSIPNDLLRPIIERQGGDGGGDLTVKNDPAFQPPHDPLTTDKKSKARAGKVIMRDIPLVTVSTNWTVKGVRQALGSHILGLFDSSGQLADEILADDRVQATLNSRMSGLFGREVIHRPAQKKRVKGSRAAREMFDLWVDHWPKMAADSYFREAHTYEILMGFSDGQLLWDTSESVWKPYPRFWHPRYEYYHWNLRKFIALTLDGPKVVFGGDGKWIHHTPRGNYRGWMWGAIRAIAEPWLLRHFAFRDMARASERHGMPIIRAYTPAAAEEEQRDRFENQVANLGTETTVLLGKGVDENDGYDLDLLEALSTMWQIFPGLIDRCDMAIVLALLFQNLTTEVKGGAYSATESHMDIRQNGIEADNLGWKSTIHDQIARPFAYFNGGDADLAPWTYWDVTPKEDYASNAARFYSFGQAIQILRQGGAAFEESDEGAAEMRKFARQTFGLRLPKTFKVTEPNSGSTKLSDAEIERAPSKKKEEKE